MENKKSLDYFANMAKNNPHEKSVKITRQSDFTKLDAKFILCHANIDTEILDLASGTGLTINKIHDQVKSIVAVEAFKEFSKFIRQSPDIQIVNEDISVFSTIAKFDLITMFGIVQYFNENEIYPIYKRYRANLKQNGKLIVKSQFGIKQDIMVSGYSEELRTNYYSHYRHIKKEQKILSRAGFKNIQVVDIYPPECNRWNNTHFYAIVAEQ